ncbi:MAG: hypothetical protein GY941_04525 [Planctomycetes bacterium]|nr:hypothetical protein [Planctomycetota bacterium]
MTSPKQVNVLEKDTMSKQDVMELVTGFGIDMTTPQTGALWTSFSRNYYKLQSLMNASKKNGNDSSQQTTFKKAILYPSTKEEKLCGVSD